MKTNQLTILGVGLIGGSVGLAAKARGLAGKVVGVGRDDRSLARAQSLGAIDEFTTDAAEGVSEADIIVVCTPVDRTATDVLAAVAAAPQRAVITDVGSTKGNILAAVQGKLPAGKAAFVGSHPLAGSEKRGPAHARADLFQDKLVIITPTAETDPEAVGVIELFWQGLGAKVIRMEADAHDQALAFTSHLPHAVAAGLAGVTPTGLLALTAGGFRDTTRIAAGDPALWSAIFRANKAAMTTALEQFQIRMEDFRRALASDNAAGLATWLTEAKQVRDALGS